MGLPIQPCLQTCQRNQDTAADTGAREPFNVRPVVHGWTAYPAKAGRFGDADTESVIDFFHDETPFVSLSPFYTFLLFLAIFTNIIIKI